MQRVTPILIGDKAPAASQRPARNRAGARQESSSEDRRADAAVVTTVRELRNLMMQPGNLSRCRTAGRSRCCWLSAWVAGLLLAGCGAETYEQRLDNTRKLFAHMEQLNAHLHRDWLDPEYRTTLRIPLQFVMLAPPVRPEPAPGETKKSKPVEGFGGTEDEPAEQIIDDRQPKYLKVDLPGLRGAFYASLKTLAGNETVSADGYIYVLSNQHLHGDSTQAAEFQRNYVELLASALRVTVALDDAPRETFPSRAGTFAKPVDYRVVVMNSPDLINGVEMQFSSYLLEQGDIQAVVLFVLPKDVDSSERLTDRVPLCLETLRIEGDKLFTPASTSSGSDSSSSSKAPGF